MFFAESRIKIGNLGNYASNPNASPPAAPPAVYPMSNSPPVALPVGYPMSNFLRIASRVEAAAQAYNSIPGLVIVNATEWKAGFQGEMVSAHLHGISITLHLE